jgi:predicted ABC-type ATPase
MNKKKQLIIIAGANGPGKSTFAFQYKNEFGLDYLGADEIVKELSEKRFKNVEIQAGKVFFNRLDSYLRKKKSVIIESTLSGLSLYKKIQQFKEQGFSVSIIYMFLDTVDMCKKRINIRVKKGGHTVAEKDIERRFHRSINNFWKYYLRLADRWQIFYNGKNRPIEVVVKGNEGTILFDEEYFNIFKDMV